MKSKSKRFAVILLSMAMMLSQMSVFSFAVVDENEPAQDQTTVEQTAQTEEAAFDESKTVDGVVVSVKAAKGVFPAGSTLSVNKARVPSSVDVTEANGAYAFDITIKDAEGNEIQPEGKATVSFKTEEVKKYDTEVYHMEGNNAEELSVSEKGSTASVKTDGFSVYVVTFRHHNYPTDTRTYTWNAKGGESKSLYDILVVGLGNKLYQVEPGTQTPTTTLRRVASCSASPGSGITVSGAPGFREEKDLSDVIVSIDNSATTANDLYLDITITPKDPTTSDYVSIEVPVKIEQQFYEVTFDTKGGTPDIEKNPQLVPVSGEGAGMVNKPVDPFKKGHVFEGWYIETPTTSKFDFGNTINSDITLVAHYKEHTHDFEYSTIENGVRTATCKNEGCAYHETPAVLTVAVNDEYIYSGDEIESTTKVENDPENLFKILASSRSIRKGTTAVTDYRDAASYNVCYQFANDNKKIGTVYKYFTVVKENVKPAKELKYNDGEPLIESASTAPESAGAQLVYSVDNENPEGGYAPTIPTNNKLTGGEHTVYYKVMVGEQTLHSDSVKVNIAPLDVTVIADNKEKYVTQNDPTFTYTAEVDGNKDDTLAFDGALKREHGEDTGVYAIKQGNLHLTEEASKNYRIKEYKDGYLTIKEPTDEPQGLELIYNAGDQALVSVAEKPSEGVFQYSYKKDDSEWTPYSKDLPTGKDAGKYSIKYRIVKDDAADKAEVKASDILQKEKEVTTTIDQAELTVTALDATTTYGRDFMPEEFTVEGIQGDDEVEVTLSTTYEKGEDADTYPIAVEGCSFTPEGVAANYDVTAVPGTLTVGKVMLTITWADDSGKYTGTEQAVVPHAAYDPEDAPKLEEKDFDKEGSTGVNAGDYTAKVTLHSDVAKNYEIVEGAEYNWDIEKAPLTVKAKDATVVYGKAAPAFEMEDENVGFVNNEGPDVIEGLKKFTTDYVMGAEVREGGYSVTPVMRSFKSDNYEMKPAESTLTVTPAPVTVTWDYEGPIEYDGETHVVTPTLKGVMAADKENVELEYATGSVHEAKDADTYVALTGLTGTKADCYAIPKGQESCEWTIAKRNVYIDWTNTSFGFDGDPHWVKYRLRHVVKGETVEPLFDNSEGFNESAMHAGGYTAKVIGLKPLEDAKNYILVKDKDDETPVTEAAYVTKGWAISRCPITVTWPSEDSFMYDGTKKSYEASFEAKEDIPYVEIALNYTSSTKEAVNVGDYDVTVNDFSVTDTMPDVQDPIVKSDYKLVREDRSEITVEDPESHTWHIVPFELKVTADSKTLNYGDAVPKLTYSVSPARPSAGEPIEATLDTTYYAGAKAGTYPITVKLGKNRNYKITAVDGTITVNAVNEAAKVLVAQGKASGKKAVKVSWNGVNGAAGYDVYFAKCNSKSKKNAPALKGSTSGNSLKIKKLKKGTCYKFYVVAKDASGNVIAQSPTGHFIAGNVSGKKTNAKSIKANTKAVTLNKGGSYTLSTSQSKAKSGKKYKLLSGGHAALTRYISSNTAVATVDSNGVIRGVGGGYCKVYALAVNGMWVEVDVNVN